MKNLIKCFFFLLLISLFSCKIQEISVSRPNNFSIEKLSLNEIKLKIILPIENKNNFSFKVKESNLFFYVSDSKIGKINTLESTKIQANSNEFYPIIFEITTKDLLSNVLLLFKELNKKEPDLYIKGDIIVKKFPIRKKIKINYKIDL